MGLLLSSLLSEAGSSRVTCPGADLFILLLVLFPRGCCFGQLEGPGRKWGGVSHISHGCAHGDSHGAGGSSTHVAALPCGFSLYLLAFSKKTQKAKQWCVLCVLLQEQGPCMYSGRDSAVLGGRLQGRSVQTPRGPFAAFLLML